jgi:hypothetical protein
LTDEPNRTNRIRATPSGHQGYELSGLIWSYPSTAVKGYGRFTTTPNGTERYSGVPTDPENTSIKVSSFTPGDQSFSPYYGGNANFINTFYWGPAAQGIQSVRVVANFNVYINDILQPQQYTARDSVQIDVLRPTGNINVTTFGSPGFGDGSLAYPGYYQVNSPRGIIKVPKFGMDAYTIASNEGVLNPPVNGINCNATVKTDATNSQGISIPLGVGGRELIAQTVKTTIMRTTRNVGNTTTTQTFSLPDGGSPYVLDGTFPYGVAKDQDTNPPIRDYIAPIGSTILFTDSPTQPLRFNRPPVSISRNDSFFTALFYQPLGGIWTPVGNITWGWSGSLTFTAIAPILPNLPGTYSRQPTTTDPPYNAATDNSFFLAWDHDFEEFHWR